VQRIRRERDHGRGPTEMVSGYREDCCVCMKRTLQEVPASFSAAFLDGKWKCSRVSRLAPTYTMARASEMCSSQR